MTVRFVGLITARGGSRRLPRKALLDCAGKPLIDWTIEAAQESGAIDQLVVSTDDEEIAEHCLKRGVSVPFMRPAALATDDATSIDVIMHAIETMNWSGEHVVLLQPTSPTRSAEDIAGASELAASDPDASILSVTRLDHPLSWLWRDDGIRRKLSSTCALPLDSTPLFRPNGALYLRRARDILADNTLISEPDCAFFEMPKLRSVDVDTQEDLDLADCILRATAMAHTTVSGGGLVGDA